MARPIRPEPKFFLIDSLYSRGLAAYERNFFPGKPEASLRGEKSTSYIESEKAAARIATCYPRARIVFLLRDPIERAISNYWFSVHNGLEPLPMAEAFRLEDERREQYDHTRLSASPYAYLSRGRYIDFIEMYQRYFPPSQLIVLIHEELVGSLEQVQQLYEQLGVRSDYVPPRLDKVINAEDRPEDSLSAGQRQELADYFADPSLRLARWMGRSLDIWPSVLQASSPSSR